MSIGTRQLKAILVQSQVLHAFFTPSYVILCAQIRRRACDFRGIVCLRSISVHPCALRLRPGPSHCVWLVSRRCASLAACCPLAPLSSPPRRAMSTAAHVLRQDTPGGPRVVSGWSQWSPVVSAGPWWSRAVRDSSEWPDVAPGWSSGILTGISRPPDVAVARTRGHRVDMPLVAGGRRRRQSAPRHKRLGHLRRVVFVYFGRFGAAVAVAAVSGAFRGSAGDEWRLPEAIVDQWAVGEPARGPGGKPAAVADHPGVAELQPPVWLPAVITDRIPARVAAWPAAYTPHYRTATPRPSPPSGLPASVSWVTASAERSDTNTSRNSHGAMGHCLLPWILQPQMTAWCPISATLCLLMYFIYMDYANGIIHSRALE